MYFYYFFIGNIKIYKHDCYSDLEDQKKYMPNLIRGRPAQPSYTSPPLTCDSPYPSRPTEAGFLWPRPLQDSLKIRGTGELFNPTPG